MKRSHSVSDQKTRLRSGGRWILLVLAVFGFAGCDDFVMYEPFQAPEAPGPLAIEPTAALVKAKQAKEFSASGGSGDYAFELFAGSGTIGSSTGIYQAPNDATEATIEVTDAAGVSTQALVFVTVPPGLDLNRTDVELEPGDEFQFEASGGVPPYEYAIADGSENIGTIEDPAEGLFVATPDLDGVTSVSGSVEVTDDVGTQVTAEVTVTENPAEVWLEPEGTVKVPENETKDFRAYGGSSPYDFGFAPEDGELLPYGTPVDRAEYIPDATAIGVDVLITATDDDGVTTSATTVQIVPATPTNLVADGSFGGPKEIRLTWNDNSDGNVGYRIERKTGSGGTFEELAVGLPADTTSFEDGDLQPNKGYTYRVFASAGDATYDSLPSNEAFDVPNP